MFIAKNQFGDDICAHCGQMSVITKDHFIPKSCRMNVNHDGNYVGVCENCNREKADRIVLPSWYQYLNETQMNALRRYMKYARSYIISQCNDSDILEYIHKL